MRWPADPHCQLCRHRMRNILLVVINKEVLQLKLSIYSWSLYISFVLFYRQSLSLRHIFALYYDIRRLMTWNTACSILKFSDVVNDYFSFNILQSNANYGPISLAQPRNFKSLFSWNLCSTSLNFEYSNELCIVKGKIRIKLVSHWPIKCISVGHCTHEHQRIFDVKVPKSEITYVRNT